MQKCSTLALNTSSISVCLRDTNHCERIEGKSTQAPNVHETDHPSVAPSVSNKILVEEWRDERIFMVPKPRTGNHKLCCCELMLPAVFELTGTWNGEMSHESNCTYIFSSSVHPLSGPKTRFSNDKQE